MLRKVDGSLTPVTGADHVWTKAVEIADNAFTIPSDEDQKQILLKETKSLTSALLGDLGRFRVNAFHGSAVT